MSPFRSNCPKHANVFGESQSAPGWRQNVGLRSRMACAKISGIHEAGPHIVSATATANDVLQRRSHLRISQHVPNSIPRIQGSEAVISD